MKVAPLLALYSKFFRLIFPAIAVIAAIFWLLFGTRVASVVAFVLVFADLAALAAFVFYSAKKKV